MVKNDVIKIIIETLKEVGTEDNNKDLINASLDTHLYGQQGNVDSFTLVRIISGIEERISETMEKDIVIASDKAMSQKNSPFLTVKTLSDFIIELV